MWNLALMLLYDIQHSLFKMNPTHKINGEKMNLDREEFLSQLLDLGGKVLENETLAFQKKFPLLTK